MAIIIVSLNVAGLFAISGSLNVATPLNADVPPTIIFELSETSPLNVAFPVVSVVELNIAPSVTSSCFVIFALPAIVVSFATYKLLFSDASPVISSVPVLLIVPSAIKFFKLVVPSTSKFLSNLESSDIVKLPLIERSSATIKE